MSLIGHVNIGRRVQPKQNSQIDSQFDLAENPNKNMPIEQVLSEVVVNSIKKEGEIDDSKSYQNKVIDFDEIEKKMQSSSSGNKRTGISLANMFRDLVDDISNMEEEMDHEMNTSGKQAIEKTRQIVTAYEDFVGDIGNEYSDLDDISAVRIKRFRGKGYDNFGDAVEAQKDIVEKTKKRLNEITRDNLIKMANLTEKNIKLKSKKSRYTTFMAVGKSGIQSAQSAIEKVVQ